MSDLSNNDASSPLPSSPIAEVALNSLNVPESCFSANETFAYYESMLTKVCKLALEARLRKRSKVQRQSNNNPIYVYLYLPDFNLPRAPCKADSDSFVDACTKMLKSPNVHSINVVVLRCGDEEVRNAHLLRGNEFERSGRDNGNICTFALHRGAFLA